MALAQRTLSAGTGAASDLAISFDWVATGGDSHPGSWSNPVIPIHYATFRFLPARRGPAVTDSQPPGSAIHVLKPGETLQ